MQPPTPHSPRPPAGTQVETTLSKMVLRIGGTAVGGTLGLAAMLSPRLAADPYVLMAIVCAFTFVASALLSPPVRCVCMHCHVTGRPSCIGCLRPLRPDGYRLRLLALPGLTCLSVRTSGPHRVGDPCADCVWYMTT